MFGIGMTELLVILVIALIVFGPKQLPELAKHLGKAMREFKKATDEVKENIGLDELGLNDIGMADEKPSEEESTEEKEPESSGLTEEKDSTEQEDIENNDSHQTKPPSDTTP